MRYFASFIRVSLQVSLLKPSRKMSVLTRACAGPFLVENKFIRLFNGYMVRFENFVTESCGFPIDAGQLSRVWHRTTIKNSFSSLHFPQQLHLSLNKRYFINLMLKYLYLLPRNVRYGPYFRRRHRIVWRPMTSKLTSCTKVVLHAPPSFLASGVTRKFLSGMQENELSY